MRRKHRVGEFAAGKALARREFDLVSYPPEFSSLEAHETERPPKGLAADLDHARRGPKKDIINPNTALRSHRNVRRRQRRKNITGDQEKIGRHWLPEVILIF
jgi:hypothetical protein